MNHEDSLTARFEETRPHLRGVAFRMLGSLSEAEDAIQEAWLKVQRADTTEVDNLRGWLTTVVARVCLDMLRSRKARAEDPVGASLPEPISDRQSTVDPEQEAVMADTIGLALLVVLETLAPAERLAFVLHDLFAIPFEDIAPIVGRTPTATRQLASRARRRVQGARASSDAALAAQRETVDAFLAALRSGDVDALVAVLDPEFVIRADAASSPSGKASEARGAETWAKQAVHFYRGAAVARPALVDGSVGVLIAPLGHLSRALRFTFADGKIREIEVIGEAERLRQLELAVIER